MCCMLSIMESQIWAWYVQFTGLNPLSGSDITWLILLTDYPAEDRKQPVRQGLSRQRWGGSACVQAARVSGQHHVPHTKQNPGQAQMNKLLMFGLDCFLLPIIPLPPCQERLPCDFQEHGAPEAHLLAWPPNREAGRRHARWPPTGPVSLPVWEWGPSVRRRRPRATGQPLPHQPRVQSALPLLQAQR